MRTWAFLTSRLTRLGWALTDDAEQPLQENAIAVPNELATVYTTFTGSQSSVCPVQDVQTDTVEEVPVTQTPTTEDIKTGGSSNAIASDSHKLDDESHENGTITQSQEETVTQINPILTGYESENPDDATAMMDGLFSDLFDPTLKRSVLMRICEGAVIWRNLKQLRHWIGFYMRTGLGKDDLSVLLDGCLSWQLGPHVVATLFMVGNSAYTTLSARVNEEVYIGIGVYGRFTRRVQVHWYREAIAVGVPVFTLSVQQHHSIWERIHWYLSI